MSAIIEKAPVHINAQKLEHPATHPVVDVQKESVAMVPHVVIAEKDIKAQVVVREGLDQEASKEKAHEVADMHVTTHPLQEVHHTEIPAAFKGNIYSFKEKFWRFFGKGMTISDGEKKPVLHALWKRFRLRDDIRVTSEEDKKKEVLKVQQENFVDGGAVHAVMDSTSGDVLGGVKKNWFKSFIRDEWTLFDTTVKAMGKIRESSWRRSFFSRLSGGLIPQKYSITLEDGKEVAQLKQHVTIFSPTHTLNIAEGHGVDKRLLVSAGLLVSSGQSNA